MVKPTIIIRSSSQRIKIKEWFGNSWCQIGRILVATLLCRVFFALEPSILVMNSMLLPLLSLRTNADATGNRCFATGDVQPSGHAGELERRRGCSYRCKCERISLSPSPCPQTTILWAMELPLLWHSSRKSRLHDISMLLSPIEVHQAKYQSWPATSTRSTRYIAMLLQTWNM